jgi:pimeloyl-ACP methyl ester carboxylesterase
MSRTENDAELEDFSIRHSTFHPSLIRMFWSIIGWIVIGYICLMLLLFFFQERLIYFPTKTWAATPATVGLPYEEVWFETADGVKLSGWFVPHHQTQDGASDSSRKVILFFHGNAGNISHRLWSLELFHRLGLSTLIIDYRGYGQSQGSPGEQGTYLDAEAAWRYLVADRQIPPDRIIVFGESLGGAVAAYLAQTHSPQALILFSTFTSVPDMGAQAYPFLPVRLLARVKYDTLARLPEIHCPVLLVHSPGDEVVPYSHGQRLFAAANAPKEFLEIRGRHNEGVLVSAMGYEAGLASFVSKLDDHPSTPNQ